MKHKVIFIDSPSILWSIKINIVAGGGLFSLSDRFFFYSKVEAQNKMAPIALPDPTFELLNRKRQIDTLSPYDGIDAKEMAEREEAALAYAGQNEAHFVTYCNDCIQTTVRANEAIRKIQQDCWNVYNENEPVSYAEKEPWQSRIVIPKPFTTIQYGAAGIKKAFSPKFLTIQNAKNKDIGHFWQTLMEIQLNEQHAKFILRFTDAVTMGLAIGVGMEMLPRWVPGKGLEYVLIEPWKIQRDPDALPRDSQSGMYWIHQEWLDYFVLKKGEENGRYIDVARVREGGDTDPENPLMTKEAIAARKEMRWERSSFRKMILTNEFWGIVLDPQGNMLLPRATFTVAANRVIQFPKTVDYPSLRWPGISFSPLPDLLKFGGRGLLKGILSVWDAINTLMCLHQDYLKWVVNPPTEVNTDGLVDPNDVEPWPGKTYQTKDTQSGQQVVRIVQRRSRTNDVLANAQYYDQQFQRGSLVTDAVQGLPGYRKDMTFRESAMNLDQALGVYGLMGENIEQGGIEAVEAGAEIIQTHAGYSDYARYFTKEELEKFGIQPDPDAPTGVKGVPRMDGTFHISGIQALMRDNETLMNLKTVILPLSERPLYAPYIFPYKALKAIEQRINIVDEGIIANEDQAKIIDMQQRLQQAKQTDAVEKLQELQEAMGITDLVKRIQEIEAGDVEGLAAGIKGIKGSEAGGRKPEAKKED